jgi:hypothetical protein
MVRLTGPGDGTAAELPSVLRGSEVLVDPDEQDKGLPFLVELLDESGQVVYQTSRREPVQIRRFLNQMDLGIDFFTLLPDLGDFAVAVPATTDDTRVRFRLREAGGTLVELGEYTLSAVDDDPGLAIEGVEALVEVRDPSQAVDIAIVGDGYTADELGLFAEDAQRVVDGFMATEPYASFADRINFWRVDVASNESGAGLDCSDRQTIPDCVSVPRDNAFGSLFPLRIAAAVTSEPVEDEILLQLQQWDVQRAASHAPADAVIVIVNTPKWGAFGLWVTSIYSGDDMPEGVVHEFGHAFGWLSDEYVNAGNPCQIYDGVPEYANLQGELATSPEDVKWSAWLTDGVELPTPAGEADVVGLFKGAGGGCPDAYRPMQTCLMQQWGQPICPVCAEHVVKRFHDTYDAVEGVSWEVDEVSAISDEQLIGHWYLDGEEAGPASESLVVPDGVSTIELIARPDTTWVRTDPTDLDETIRISR